MYTYTYLEISFSLPIEISDIYQTSNREVLGAFASLVSFPQRRPWFSRNLRMEIIIPLCE